MGAEWQPGATVPVQGQEPYSRDDAMQGSGSVAVRFISSPAAYCARFGGIVKKDEQGVAFNAKDAPAPPSCPVPPVSCP